MHPGLAALGLVAFAHGLAYAEDLTEEESEIQIHGFVSQGALLTSDNNYLARTERGSLEFTEAGIALAKQLDPKLRVGFQLFTRDLGPVGNYSAKIDWFSLDYRWKDWLGVRAGRTKLPFGLYNDTVDIDAAHPVVLLPQSIYPIANRDFFLAQTGIELYGYRRIGALGALDYRAYAGTIYLQLQDTSTTKVVALDVPYITGGRLMWETPAAGLRLGGSVSSGRIDGDFIQFGVPASIALRQSSWLASLEYQADALVFSAEYGRAYADTTVTAQGAPAQVVSKTSQNGYVMASYRLTSWLQPAAYYSILYPSLAMRIGAASRQHDAAVTLRFDITPNWILKLEGHSMRGTAALDLELDDSVVNKWYLLAAKTTVYF